MKMLNKDSNVKKALESLKKGEIIIVVDDEDRENEGDFVYPAQFSTAEKVNFLIKNGKGLVCVSMTQSRATYLSLPLMIGKKEGFLRTAFTVSVDLKKGITTGISADDRSKTIKALVDDSSKATDFVRPGHMFPLIACSGGIIERRGQTEASVNLLQLAGLKPVSVICEIINDDGSMARAGDLKNLAKKFGMVIVSIDELSHYVIENSLEDKIKC